MSKPVMPKRMRKLPRTPGGFVKPWFVKADDFREVDGDKAMLTIRDDLCWICGQKMKKHYTFVGGPKCHALQTYSEPPCHRSCAEYAAQVCPFIIDPNRQRRMEGLSDEAAHAADVLGTVQEQHNPEFYVLNTVKTYSASLAPPGVFMFRFHEYQVVSTSVWHRGKRLSPAEQIELNDAYRKQLSRRDFMETL